MFLVELSFLEVSILLPLEIEVFEQEGEPRVHTVAMYSI